MEQEQNPSAISAILAPCRIAWFVVPFIPGLVHHSKITFVPSLSRRPERSYTVSVSLVPLAV